MGKFVLNIVVLIVLGLSAPVWAGCCGCGCCCPCPCCCTKPIVIKLPPPPTKIVPCCGCCCCKPCCCCCKPCCCCSPCCCCPCCGGGRRRRQAVDVQNQDSNRMKSLLMPRQGGCQCGQCGSVNCDNCARSRRECLKGANLSECLLGNRTTTRRFKRSLFEPSTQHKEFVMKSKTVFKELIQL